MEFPSHRTILQSLVACLFISVLVFVQENRFVFYKTRSQISHVPAQNGTELCEILHVVLSALTEDDRMKFHVTAKSLLFHARSVVVSIDILINNSSRTIIDTLMKTWDLKYVWYELIETNAVALDYRQPILSMANILLGDPSYIESHETNEWFFVKPGVIFQADIAHLRDNLLDYVATQTNQEVIALACNSSESSSEVALLYVQLNQSLTQDDNQTCTEFNSNDSDEILLDDWLISMLCNYNDFMMSLQSVTSGLIGYSTHSAYRDWIRFDGDVLRTTPHQCFDLDSDVTQPPSKGDKCYEYKYLATLSRRTHVAFIRTPPSSSPSSITLVTQLQPNRLQGLERLLMEWRGPASVALYASDEEAVDFAKYFRSNTKLRTLPDLVVHLVFKRQKQYPINYLRNVAMREVLTQYHLMLDVDFVPNSGLAQHAQNIFEKLSTTEETPVALVVPTFETSNSSYKIAENRSEFLHHLDEGKVLSYHQTAQWNLGHRYTSYAKWKTATDPYKVYGAFGYEPYLVIRAQDSPEYSELLLERMRDKFTYTVEVQVAGFQMFVLPDAYAVHMPHPKSTSHRLRKEDTSFEPCTSLIYQQVIRNISRNYPNSHTAEFIAKQFPPTKRPTTRKRRKKKRKKKPVASPASTTPHP